MGKKYSIYIYYRLFESIIYENYRTPAEGLEILKIRKEWVDYFLSVINHRQLKSLKTGISLNGLFERKCIISFSAKLIYLNRLLRNGEIYWPLVRLIGDIIFNVGDIFYLTAINEALHQKKKIIKFYILNLVAKKVAKLLSLF